MLSIVDRFPQVSQLELVNSLVPPPQFTQASFANYLPNPQFSSQQSAKDLLEQFVTPSAAAGRSFSLFRSKPKAPSYNGVYLDGGFGVGKTHLLAASWHAFAGRKVYGTFMQYTALVGALGYAAAKNELAKNQLLCIDEFELDDPGDTMIMTRLLGELIAGGSKIIATSNTPPNALGEGRFGADSFLREIKAIAACFETVRIDGEDYRQRDILTPPEPTAAAVLLEAAQRIDGASFDVFADLLRHAGSVHPSAYAWLVKDLPFIAIENFSTLDNQHEALLFVALVDRIYDAQIPLAASGVPVDRIFTAEMLEGGYRKKYLRAISRLIALSEKGRQLTMNA